MHVKVRGEWRYFHRTIDRCGARLVQDNPTHHISKRLPRGVKGDQFPVKNIPETADFRPLVAARRAIAGFEAMLWLKGFFRGLDDPSSERTACVPPWTSNG